MGDEKKLLKTGEEVAQSKFYVRLQTNNSLLFVKFVCFYKKRTFLYLLLAVLVDLLAS